jgi:hypothetical protein
MGTIERWINAAKISGGILRNINRSEKIGSTLSGGQINSIYKRLVQHTGPAIPI